MRDELEPTEAYQGTKTNLLKTIICTSFSSQS